MAAYIVIDRLSVIDPEALGTYQILASAAVTSHGGSYVFPQRTRIEALEGNWKPSRIVMVEFEDGEKARQWWNSPEYAEARAIHREATISNVILVDGAWC